MKRHCLAILAAFLMTVSAEMTMAAEFSDSNIVISDNWCAPYNDGACNTCNYGHVINQATCTGSYCDNMIYHCKNPVLPGHTNTVTVVGPSFIMNDGNATKRNGWTSDEQGVNSNNAVCPLGYAMVGMYSVGSYSDDVRVVCQQLAGWQGVAITVYRSSVSISEEAPNTSFGTNLWLSGASCTGSYCDNMYYWATAEF